MNGTTAVGIIAAILVNAAFVPQAIKSWQTKKTDDLSLVMYFVYVTGIGLWLVYGIITADIPIILSESTGLVLVLSVLYLKIRYG